MFVVDVVLRILWLEWFFSYNDNKIFLCWFSLWKYFKDFKNIFGKVFGDKIPGDNQKKKILRVHEGKAYGDDDADDEWRDEKKLLRIFPQHRKGILLSLSL